MSTAAYSGVAIVCPITIAYERRTTRSAYWFIGQALRALLCESGLNKIEIDGLVLSSFTLGPDTTIAATEHFGMSPRHIDWLPTGGASGVMALRRAARVVQCGDAEVVACIAGDTFDAGSFGALVRGFSRFSREAVLPYGAAGPNGSFALITRNYMEMFGARREDFGHIVLAQRANARANPNALLGQKPITLEDYLSAPPIATPIHLFDCVMPCAGAEGFLVMSTTKARRLGLPYAILRGGIERHNAFFDDPIAQRGGWAMDSDNLYAQAAVGPFDLDCVQTYDDYPVIVAMQLEDLGFCAKGEGASFARDHDLTVAGDFPHNTCGGQLACGQAGAAGGFLGINEALRQILHRPLGRQVPGARLALASGYGMVTYDRCLATGAVILEGVR